MYTRNNYILGLDCSHYQKSIDWTKAKADVIQFAYVKLTEGDTVFEGNTYKLKDRCAEVLKQGIKLGYYHFCRPGNYILPVDDAKQEADHILTCLTDMPKYILPFGIDLEAFTANPKWQDKKSMIIYLTTFIARLGLPVVIYSNKYFLENNLDNSFNDYPLWHAGYTKNPSIAKTWADWDIWQFTDEGIIDGVQGQVDLNWMKQGFFDKYNHGTT